METETITDLEWLDEIILQNYSRLKKSAYYIAIEHGIASPAHWAEDMTQEVFLRLSAQIGAKNLRAHPNIVGWLMKTLTYVIGSQWQKQSEQEILVAEVWEHSSEPVCELGIQEDPFPPGMTAAERDILYRYRCLGYSQTEIAESLGISPSACRKRLERAEKKCRKMLSDSRKDGKKRSGEESAMGKGGVHHA